MSKDFKQPNQKIAQIEGYLLNHPAATVREIQKAFGYSSTPVVQHHLNKLRGKDKTKKVLKVENAQLQADVKELVDMCGEILKMTNHLADKCGMTNKHEMIQPFEDALQKHKEKEKA